MRLWRGDVERNPRDFRNVHPNLAESENVGSHVSLKMKSLKVISDTVATFSNFIKLRNVKFIQNGMQRSWDYISVIPLLSDDRVVQ